MTKFLREGMHSVYAHFRSSCSTLRIKRSSLAVSIGNRVFSMRVARIEAAGPSQIGVQSTDIPSVVRAPDPHFPGLQCQECAENLERPFD